MKKVLLLILVCSTVLLWSNLALSLPFLQLDIIGGEYVLGPHGPGEGLADTTIATSDSFTLRALVDPDQGDPNGIFYVSAAVVPKMEQSDPPPTLGTFSFGGTSYNVTGDMVYGTPPVIAAYPDFPPHGVFETYYKEFDFSFDFSNTIGKYNTADPSDTPPGNLYYQDFEVDVSGLAEGYAIHFDLYHIEVIQRPQGIEFSLLKAPPSHDAQSGGHPGNPIPEPTTILLVGLGLLGIAGFKKKLRK